MISPTPIQQQTHHPWLILRLIGLPSFCATLEHHAPDLEIESNFAADLFDNIWCGCYTTRQQFVTSYSSNNPEIEVEDIQSEAELIFDPEFGGYLEMEANISELRKSCPHWTTKEFGNRNTIYFIFYRTIFESAINALKN